VVPVDGVLFAAATAADSAAIAAAAEVAFIVGVAVGGGSLSRSNGCFGYSCSLGRRRCR